MKNSIIKSLMLLQLLLVSYNLCSQTDSINKTKIPETDRKYIVWVSPSKATHVYGLMFNVWNKDSMPYPKIYGAELNICPAAVFAPFLIGLYSLNISQTFHAADSMVCPANYNGFKKVNGLQLGFINLEPTVINGLDISTTGSFESVTNGITISGIRNNHFVVNGLTIAVLANTDDKCRGTQIALINTCNNLKGFQFGLWNKNQKRSLPFINWAFKS